MGRQQSHTMQPHPPLCPALPCRALPIPSPLCSPSSPSIPIPTMAEQPWGGIHWIPHSSEPGQGSGPSFQVLNPFEFILHCFHFILLQGKVLILIVLSPTVAFFPCKHPSST